MLRNKAKKINAGLIEACLRGETTYKFGALKWVVTSTTTGSHNASAQINKKGTPPGNPPSAPDGMHWECTSVSSKKNNSTLWTTTTTYETVFDD